MTMDELGKVVGICFFSLGGSAVISQGLNAKNSLDLRNWVQKNRPEKWKRMRLSFYGITYIFNAEDMNVELVKILKRRLRKHFKFLFLIFSLLITMFLAVIFVLTTGIVKGGPGWPK